MIAFRVIFWEWLQNLPFLLCLGFSTILWPRSWIFALIIGLLGSFISSGVIELTQHYKHGKTNRTFDYSAFVMNGILFCSGVWVYLIYYQYGNIILDGLIGFILGLLGGYLQGSNSKYWSSVQRWRNTIAMGIVGLSIFVGLRLAIVTPQGVMLGIIIALSILMTSIISFINYGYRY